MRVKEHCLSCPRPPQHSCSAHLASLTGWGDCTSLCNSFFYLVCLVHPDFFICERIAELYLLAHVSMPACLSVSVEVYSVADPRFIRLFCFLYLCSRQSPSPRLILSILLFIHVSVLSCLPLLVELYAGPYLLLILSILPVLPLFMYSFLSAVLP
jgi:hypothetical protein